VDRPTAAMDGNVLSHRVVTTTSTALNDRTAVERNARCAGQLTGEEQRFSRAELGHLPGSNGSHPLLRTSDPRARPSSRRLTRTAAEQERVQTSIRNLSNVVGHSWSSLQRRSNDGCYSAPRRLSSNERASMAEQVNRSLWATGLSLAPGQTQQWIETGQVYGRVRWFFAQPLALSGVERAVEVERVVTRVLADGTRRVEVTVRNVGTTFANYGVYVAETTGP
jgi:hypothetical protein